jgi:hypothetical protein
MWLSAPWQRESSNCESPRNMRQECPGVGSMREPTGRVTTLRSVVHPRRSSEEVIDVGSKFGMMLEEKPVCRVRIDLYLGLRY